MSPMRPASPCSVPGCPAKAVSRGRCEKHAQEAAAARRRNEPSPRVRGYTTAWDKLRAAYIKQHPDCERCGAAGPEGMIVDHILPKRAGGPDDWNNLQTLCRQCHGAKTSDDMRQYPEVYGGGPAAPAGQGQRPYAFRRATFGASRTPVTIVAGPPGAGKSTYVAKHKGAGDLVVDVDLLYQALTGGLPLYEKPDELLPFVCEARDAVIARLARASNIRRAWIITGQAYALELLALKEQLQAEHVIVLEVSPAECLRRIGEDARRAPRAHLWAPLVHQWWERWQGSKGLLDRGGPIFA